MSLNNETRSKQVTTMKMECFLGTTPLDQATADMLHKIDESGAGSFNKEEIVSIVSSLQDTIRKNESLGNSNKVIKRFLIGSIVFIVLLLGSMLSLSFVVAAWTSKTEAQADGTLLAKGSTMAIATDTRANIHDVTSVDSTYCMSETEINAIKSEVVSGKNVFLQLTDADTDSKSLEQLLPTGATFTKDTACFWLADQGKHGCFKKLDGASCRPLGDSGLRLQSSSCEAKAWAESGSTTSDSGYLQVYHDCLAEEGTWAYDL